ncbi:hypothetical protein GCM10008956_31340 [Deinococcus arenae]|uniref:Transmembrane protein n=1 Tax=Deinococcus arenae TaxID=1452751 RepID=A0A8H9GXE9_9DEIO|nr:DUF6766 family protein [Deinococcus arenae]GGM53036.1 hypothetical protein GCM10008956_31340 [Deinococcus arenae]
MKRFWSENALSVVLTGLFLLFWAAQAMTGWQVHNQELEQARQHTLTWTQYLRSAHFWSATTENWESEFLQMAAFVILTIYLRQRGSAESNPFPDEQSAAQRRQDEQEAAQRGFWRRNSLSAAFVLLFTVVLTLHFFSSWGEYNLDQQAQGQAAVSVSGFLHQPEFWFESFQNWQSEFLAVVAIVVLSISLRQLGSSQSKSLLDPNEKTGSA